MYGFPADYLSEEMFEAIGWAVDEAKKHGMRFWIYDEYNWPSGAAGGYLIRDNPDRRMLVVTSDEQASEHGPQDDQTVWQCEDESGKATVFRETPQNGVAPFGQWSPFCWGQEGYGDVCDPETVRAFIELTHEAYRSRFPGELGKTIAGSAQREPPVRGKGSNPTFHITTSTFFQPDRADTRRLSWKRVSYVSLTPVSTSHRHTEEAG